LPGEGSPPALALGRGGPPRPSPRRRRGRAASRGPSRWAH
jgi:hypothetical protein